MQNDLVESAERHHGLVARRAANRAIGKSCSCFALGQRIEGTQAHPSRASGSGEHELGQLLDGGDRRLIRLERRKRHLGSATQAELGNCLALVEKIVSDLGGIVEYAREGTPPKTVFRLLLPRARVTA